MAALIDDNIFLRLAQSNHPPARIAERALNLLHVQGETFNVASQNLIECRVVAIRPRADNGLILARASVYSDFSDQGDIQAVA